MGYTYFHSFRSTLNRQKPSRKELDGLSPSELKTLLKRNNFKIKRGFFKYGSIARKGSRLYRFRYNQGMFVVDISEEKKNFDRWSNSVQEVQVFSYFRRNLGVISCTKHP